MYKAILGLRERPLSAFLQTTCWPKAFESRLWLMKELH